jgi:hypothetical protein
MKNLFRLMTATAILAGSLAFGQKTSEEIFGKKPVIKVIHCKKFTATVHIGIVDLGTEVTGCLVTIDGWPIMVWTKQAQLQNNGQLTHVYVEEKELMSALKVEDPKQLENFKVIKSDIWDYNGVNYVINTEIKYEVVEVNGQKYYALPLKKVE